MDNTPFDVWPGSIRFNHECPYAHSQLLLNKGDAIVFRGDLVHAGAAFDRFNARVHVYLDHSSVARNPNETFLVRQNGFDLIQPRGG